MSMPASPRTDRRSEFTQPGMRRASPRSAALSSGAKILVCSRSASRKVFVLIASSILPPALCSLPTADSLEDGNHDARVSVQDPQHSECLFADDIAGGAGIIRY